MITVVADTGPLYALADPSDQYHQRATRELDRLHAEGLYVSICYPSACEAYTLVSRRLGLRYARSWLDELMTGITLINPEAGDYQAAQRSLAKFPDRNLTLFEAVAAAICARLGLSIWAFDRHFDPFGIERWAPRRAR